MVRGNRIRGDAYGVESMSEAQRDEAREPAGQGDGDSAARGSDRAQARREQILDAASECFARKGFHAASIARISERAGMSAGHIYHFFENKEEIVSGIVERLLERWLDLLVPYPPDNIDEELMQRARAALAQRTQPAFIGLWLEVLAETARNPALGPAVHSSDAVIRERVGRLVRELRAARGIETETPIETITEVALALYEGLSNRMVLNPGLDPAQIEDVLLKATVAIIEA